MKNANGVINLPRIWFPASAKEVLIEEAERALPCETGGIMLGYLGQTGEAVVTEVVGPGPRAMHSPDWFAPDYYFHEEAAFQRWHLSGGTETYLGDWHSHPESSPYLSPKDRQALRRIARGTENGIKYPYMAVLGGADPWTLGVWHYAPRRWKWLPARIPIACDVHFYES